MMQNVPEVKLYNNNKEREIFDNMADLYSIIKTAEHLEKANMRDAVSQEEHHKVSAKLRSQYLTARKLTQTTVPDVKKFMQDYRLSAEAGFELLTSDRKDEPKIIAETVQFFITAMDSLKLNMVAVDQIHPLLNDVYSSLCNIRSLSPTFDGKVKIKNWLDLMSTMKASDELDEQQIRQLLFDLDSSYAGFHSWLEKK
eukprot:TRINITY_DN10914_c0_g1_i1.p1 TRINITY_DN10914_c0_g1~~TRINITY_DN10914_c0_g1_i1.p1  ORF type:complete len:198 (+),score=35.62 TRINITY_DN10914_c0_g1_i1:26-619(+)